MGIFATPWKQKKPPTGWLLDADAAAQMGLIKAWPMLEGAGFRSAELIGGRTGAFVGGCTWKPNNKLSAGPYLNFDGSTGYFKAAGYKIIASLKNSSVCAWVNSSSTDFAQSVIYVERGASGNDIWKMEKVEGGTGTTLSFTHRDDAGTLTQADSGLVITAATNPQWVHIAITKNGTAIKMWVNGVSVAATLNGNDTMTDADIEAWIGGDKGDNTAFWLGGIDNVQVFNRTLSTADVLRTYRDPFWYFLPMNRPVFYSGPVTVSTDPIGRSVVVNQAVNAASTY